MKYHNITKDDMNNGDGLRVVLWVAGCNHHCKGCQNPQTWNPEVGLEFDETTYEEICKELEKDYVSGITLSGGDPLHENNREAVYELLSRIKDEFPNKTIWLYTGYKWGEIKNDQLMSSIMCLVDILVDGRFDEKLADKNYKWAGSTNQQVIDVQQSIKKGQVVLYEGH